MSGKVVIPRLLAELREAGGGIRSIGDSMRLRVRGGSAVIEYLFRRDGKVTTNTLGPATMTLTDARKKRAAIWSGNEPVMGRHVTAPARAGRSFGEALSSYLEVNAPAWKGGTEGAEAKAYRNLAKLNLAKLDVARVDREAIVAALDPWKGTPTSEKLRIRIKSVLDHAIAKQWRDGDNPARRDVMKRLLQPVNGNGNHHASMPWQEVPALMAELRKLDTEAARALMFTILTAGRAGEIAGAAWSEIEGDVWTIPGKRMKEGREHRVPLAPEALAVLGERGDGLIFTLARGAMRIQLQKLRPGITVHGFRSTFIDWAAEHEYPSELREMALAHAVGDDVERRYKRTDLLKLRREMMEAWAVFATCDRKRPNA